MYVITELPEDEVSLVGSKAWRLLLLKKDFTIPEFAVITTKGYREYRRVKKITPELCDELNQVLTRFLKDGPIVIRSSATSEDMPGVSFAGMYNTTLNIRSVEDGLQAVIDTWRSIESDRVSRYRKKMGIPVGEMAVIIQHQLNPDISGVLVTKSPFSVAEMLIECCEGLGDKLVSGKITPTSYRVKGEGVIERRGAALLSENETLQITRMGLAIEKIFESPQDIEWAIEAGTLYLLQSRPINVHGSVPRRSCTVWTNANVRETIPDPISPMGWSIFRDVAFPCIAVDVFGIPITKKKYDRFPIIELLSGRMYWNVNNSVAYMQSVAPILNIVEGIKAIDPQFDEAFKAVGINHLPKPISTIRMVSFTLISLIRLSYFILLGFFRYRWLSRKLDRLYEISDIMYKRFKPVDDFTEGIKNIKSWLSTVLIGFARGYFGGVLLSGFYLAILGKILGRRLGKKGEAIARQTHFGIRDKTGEMVIALGGLASLAKQTIKTVSIPCLRELYSDDNEFRDHFDKFIGEFGHRGPAEFDIACMNFREDPEKVFRLIQTTAGSRVSPADRKKMISELISNLRPAERFFFKLFVPRIEVFTPFREDAKHIYLKALDKLKDQLMVMGRLLKKEGFLKNERDIFFLFIGDLEKINNKELSKDDILKIIRERRREWLAYRQAEPPEIIYGSGERITAGIESSDVLHGEPLTFGLVKARAKIIRSFDESHRLKKGEILITHHTDPGWTPLFTVASGIIVEVGGVICHAAMVAREFGIPAIVIRGATSLIKNGQMVELDADGGVARLS
ncbi:MAG TPA: hypothetical protein EYP58_05650 [bacterium (Candidatus Stahlbacteria)]|nr:hypothetical protein [Candidatus Stahlbacteria bacterium]